MVRLSVIVPIYNVEQYLRRCLDSLVNQTMEDIEIILVNDASPDNSIDIMKEYEREYPDKVFVIDSKVNLRQGGARNLGIRAAKGEYIGFVDSDDWVRLDMFEHLYFKAIENDADIVSCNCVRARSVNDYSSLQIRDLSYITGVLDETKRENIILDGSTPGIWSRIYRKKMIIDHDLWFPEHLFYEDNLWGPLVFFYANTYYHINECYYYYFINPSSTITSTESMHHFDRLTIEIMKLEEYRKRGLYENNKDAIEFSFIQLFYANSLHLAFSRFKRPPFAKVFEMRKYVRENFPEYRDNKYFNRINEFGRLLTAINDISPYKAYEWYKTVTQEDGN